MQSLAEPVSKLIDAFSKLPGIGPKTASRLVYFLLRSVPSGSDRNETKPPPTP